MKNSLILSHGVRSSELKKRGHKLPKKEFDAMRKAIKKSEKKHEMHNKYLAVTMCLEGYELNQSDEDLMFPEPLMAKPSQVKYMEQDKEKEDVSVPVQLVFGVTLTLCGLFLMVIPFPACKPWGEKMIASGFVICGNCISGKVDNDQKNDKDKDKNNEIGKLTVLKNMLIGSSSMKDDELKKKVGSLSNELKLLQTERGLGSDPSLE